LILWSLSSSDIVKSIITTNYKQNRHEDDLNQPLSVQPWGSDSYRRRYYLIEGLDDTHFRIYRESSHTGIKRTWWSVAGDIDELKALAEKLSKMDGGQKARTLSEKMMQAIPRFEATEEVSSQDTIQALGVTNTTYSVLDRFRSNFTDTACRNESAVNTAKCVSSSSSDQNLISPCMRVGREGNA
jgi:hypothetical protein